MRNIILALMMAGGLWGDSLTIKAAQVLLDEALKIVPEMSPSELAKLIENDADFTLVDLRAESQLHRGEIYATDMKSIDRGYLEFKVEQQIPDKKRKVVVYCCTGNRSLLAAESLKKMGYTNVYSLKGGLQKWVESGHILDTSFGEMKLAK